MAITLTRASFQDVDRFPEFVALSTDGFPPSDDPAVVNGAECLFMDIQTRYKYSKEDDTWYEMLEGGDIDRQGILVKIVDQNDTMPTTRSDGSPLENEDYVKPKPTATFPFTINGVTFENKFSKAIWFNGEWIVDVGLIQDTSETPLATPSLEKWEIERPNQKQLNLDIIDQLKNEIIYYTNLNNVPADKLYKRIYRQTLDTADRPAGLYWYNFDKSTWEKFGASDIEAGIVLPTGKYEGQLFILLQTQGTGANEKHKGLYRYNGTNWIKVEIGYTNETLLFNPEEEKYEEVRENQYELNKDIVYELKNMFIEYADLNTVPADKLYKRIYRQTADTADRTEGLYYYNFVTSTWEKFGSGDINAGNNLPVAKYEGELFILLQTETIGGVDFHKGLYRYNGTEWVRVESTYTNETLLFKPDEEKFEEERENQYELNLDIMYQLKNMIINYDDLDTVPNDKLYKRIYRQMTDTNARRSGLYWYDFESTETDKWQPLDGGNIPAGTALPSGKYVGDLFILLEDVPQAGKKVKKGLYRFDGNLWVHIAHTEPWTSEIEVDDSETESISKTATTQKEINEENALIIGQEKEIEVDEEVDLIGAVNWLMENKLGKKKLKVSDDNHIVDDDDKVYTLAELIALFNDDSEWMYLEHKNIIFLPEEPKDATSFKFVGNFTVPEKIHKDDDETVMIDYSAEVSVGADGIAHYAQIRNEQVDYKVADLYDFKEHKDEFKTPEDFYPNAVAVINYDKGVINVETNTLPTNPEDKYIYHFTTDIEDYKAGYYGYYNGEYKLLDKDNITKVEELPTEVEPLVIYELTEDFEDYEKGLYYPVLVEGELHWLRLDNTAGWEIKDSVMEIEKGEEVEDEDTRIDKLKLTVTNDKDEEVIKTETDIDVKLINIYHYIETVDEDVVYEYEFHAKEREKEEVIKFTKFSSPTPFTLKASDPRYLEAGDGTTFVNAGNGVDSVQEEGRYVIYLRGKQIQNNLGNTYLTLTGNNITIAGDLRELLNYENPDEAVVGKVAFRGLFINNTSIVDASKLVIPAQSNEDSYRDMFANCTNLVSAPSVISDVSGRESCARMFAGCSSLVNPPTLPATELGDNCYWEMFMDCASLTTAPVLPATNIPQYAYAEMFAKCTSLTTIQDVFPATDYAKYACNGMFDGCANLAHLPDIFAANQMGDYAFAKAFRNTLIKVYESSSSGYNRTWRMPIASGSENWHDNMFYTDVDTFNEGSYYYTND